MEFEITPDVVAEDFEPTPAAENDHQEHFDLIDQVHGLLNTIERQIGMGVIEKSTNPKKVADIVKDSLLEVEAELKGCSIFLSQMRLYGYG